jgi:hypothetical protein
MDRVKKVKIVTTVRRSEMAFSQQTKFRKVGWRFSSVGILQTATTDQKAPAQGVKKKNTH